MRSSPAGTDAGGTRHGRRLGARSEQQPTRPPAQLSVGLEKSAALTQTQKHRKASVIQTSRVGPVHETDQRLELLTAGSEPSLRSRLPTLTAGVAVLSDRTITTTAPERQDFAHRRVKFTSTGVEIGGHVRPPPWSTKDMNNADFDTLFMTPRPRPALHRRPPPDSAEHPNPRRGPAQRP